MPLPFKAEYPATSSPANGAPRFAMPHTREATSFLGDYSKLKQGKRGRTLLRYRQPDIDWASFTNIKLDPVTLWQEPEEPMLAATAQDRQKMADKFYGLLFESLSRSHRIVAMPIPHTLRVQVALTDSGTSTPAMDTVSTILPLGTMLSHMDNFSHRQPLFIHTASLEIKISNASDGTLLAAGVDRNVGGEFLNPATESWEAALNALAFWADFLAYRLGQVSGNLHTAKPHPATGNGGIRHALHPNG